MVQRKVFGAFIGAGLLVMGSASKAADYRADEFFGLDLSKAVLSPKRLGPPTEFAPVPLEARGDVASSGTAKSDAAKSDAAKSDTAKTDTAKIDTAKTDVASHDVATTEPVPARPERGAVSQHGSAPARVRVEKPHAASRTKLAHRHGNPLDAQARDTGIRTPPVQTPRIQTPRIRTWPCNAGGICDWKQ